MKKLLIIFNFLLKNQKKMTMKNSTVFLIFLLLCFQTKAQVGLGTQNPQTDLDVNGDVNIRQDLKFKGTESEKGNPGIAGQVLVSNGSNNSPEWKTLKIPFATNGEYQLVSTNILYDRNGINFGSNTNNNATSYISTVGNSINSNNPAWTQIPALESNVVVEQEGNTLSLVFQTGVESNSGANNITDNRVVRYMCGIFQNNLLVAFRGDELLDVHRKTGNNEGIYTLSYSVDDLPLGTHNFKVACRRIQTTAGTYQFAIGRSIENSTVSNNFMLQSIVKIELLEPVIYQ